MLVQPQQAATVCELDLVQHAIRSWKRAQTLDPNQRPENSDKPLNLTLDREHAHVSSRSAVAPGRLFMPHYGHLPCRRPAVRTELILA